MLVELDANANPWWVIQDEGGDVVALCDTGGSGTRTLPGEGGSTPITITVANLGRVAAQWTYDAYGAVQSAADLFPHPVMRAGHKGLFCERLDTSVGLTGELTPRLVPYAANLYHVRNRAYMPSLGRWLQVDPNASGMSLENEARFFGSKLDPTEPTFSMSTRFSDGMSGFEYLRSVPWRRTDPMGLISATGVAMLFVPTPADFITGMLQEVVEEYASNQEWDVDWATDWDQGDDWSTREDNGWIEEAMLRGLYNSFEIGIPGTNIGFNPLDTFAGAYSNPATTPGSQNVWSKPIQGHHIATKDGAFGARNRTIFAGAGMSIDDPANKVSIPHSGRHNREYHVFVQKRIEKATSGLSATEAKRALQAELKALEDFVARNPHFLYNSIKGAKTGWKGLRELNVHMHGGRYRYRPRR